MGQIFPRPWRFAWRLLKGTVAKFIHDGGSFLAAGLAFNLLLYCVPFLLLIISTLAYTLGSSEKALARVQASAKQLLPQSSEAFAYTLTTIIEHRNILGVLAVPLFFVLSSWLFGAIRHVLNTVYEVPKTRSYFKQKMTDLVLILVVGCLVLLSVGIGSLLAVLQALSEHTDSLRELLQPGWVLTTYVVVFLFTAALFYTFYRFSPAESVSRNAVIVSALSGAALFSLSRRAFAWYVALAKGNTLVYGALAGIIFFYLWLYYACLVFIIAAEMGWVLDRQLRSTRRASRS
jgi:membrane protein